MGRVLKPLLVGALALGVAVTGIGIAAGLGASFAAGTFGAGLVSALGTGIIVSSGIAALQGGLSYFQKARSNLSQFDPKSVNIDPAAPRKLAFGLTPLAMDVRYVEPSGTNQEYIDYIVALAAHKCHEIDSIYIEEDLAWTPGGGAVGKFAGYLTIEVILEAGAAAYHTVNGGAIWGSTRRLTGCTTMKVRVKRSDNSKSSQSPFGGGIAGRWTVVGRGIPVYDPARDSTVAGGSGSQRATDQTTWAYTVSGIERGNNPALQLLAFLLGWRIGGEVSVGVGLPVDVIDLPSFASAAALCDESVALNGGGTQRRYEAGRTFSDADDPMAVVTELLKAMNGELTDDGGRLALRIAVNDLTPVVTLTDDDFVGGFSWQPQPPIDQQYTVVRGRYVQPGPPSLFGFADFPEVEIPRTSNAPRPLVLELTAVQEPRRAERIAKQAAQRSLYQGTFTVTLGIRGWLLRRNMVVAITSNARGWTAKMFRVRSLNFNDDGTVEAVFREENAAIYAWDRDESPVVTPVTPVVFDSRAAASWLMADIAPGATNTAPANANRVRFSLMEGNQGWKLGFNPSNVPFTEIYATDAGRPVFVVQTQTTATGQDVVLSQAASPAAAWTATPGERLSVQAVIDVIGPVFSWNLLCQFVCADGTRTPVSVATANGERPIANGIVAGFIDVPTGGASPVVGGYLDLEADSSGAGTLQLAILHPMVASAQAGQTAHPAFVPGPSAAAAADVTALALPAVSQGEWQAGRNYRIGDLVFANNATWTATSSHTSATGNRPGIGPWGVFVASPSATVTGTATSAAFSTGVLSSGTFGGPLASITVTVGSGGIVDLSAVGVTDLESGAAATAALKVQRDVSPGVWADVDTERTLPSVSSDADLQSRDFSVTWQETGLTPGSNQTFRILARRFSASGEVTAAGQFAAAGR